jgi:hypothetical protein
MTELDAASHYLEEVRRQFRGYKKLAEGALAQITDQEMFLALDAESNSAAVIVKHMAGNMRSRFTDFLTSDGEKPDRHRDQEFEVHPGMTRAEVLAWWDAGWASLSAAVDVLKPEDVMRTVTIRGEPHTVLQALNRQVAHYAYHTGQIVFLAKHLRSQDWKSLSVPRGKSGEVNQKMMAARKAGPHQS